LSGPWFLAVLSAVLFRPHWSLYRPALPARQVAVPVSCPCLERDHSGRHFGKRAARPPLFRAPIRSVTNFLACVWQLGAVVPGFLYYLFRRAFRARERRRRQAELEEETT